ncbi:MAG TPA: aldose epimerase family protein [Chroococcales cyanobacterium]
MKASKSALFGWGILYASLAVLMPLSSTGKESPEGHEPNTGVAKTSFGKTKTGDECELYTLTNKNSMKATVTSYGATLTELWAPDKNGKLSNVVLGFDTLPAYEANKSYFGATIGRYANRIAGAKFTLGKSHYSLFANDGKNTLHGGKNGFDKRVWQSEILSDADVPSVRFSYRSADMEEGFPGTLSVTVTYSLTDRNELKIDYTAATDKETVVNLTNHSYFNLSGAGTGDILNHMAQINAEHYTPVDNELIPTGEFASVKGSAFDFTRPKPIGQDIKDVPGGYDHNFVLRKHGAKLYEALRIDDPQSGRRLIMLTTEPGVQFYTGNFLDGGIEGNGGRYAKHGAFCIEAQHFPDSMHHPNFPTVVLKPDETYNQTTIYRFTTAKE